MVLGKLPVPGRPTIWITVGQGPTALTVGAGGGCLDIFTLIYPFSPLSPSLWETARYRLKYCLKGPLNPKQPTNQILEICTFIKNCTPIKGTMHLYKNCTTIHRYPIFSTIYSVMCKVYTGYCGTSEIEHGLCACTVDNPLAKARGLSLRTGVQTMLYLPHVHLYKRTAGLYIIIVPYIKVLCTIYELCTITNIFLFFLSLPVKS